MISKRTLWGLCAVVIIFFLWLLYPQKEEAPQPEKAGDIKTSVRISISDSLIAKTTKLLVRQAINHTDTEKMTKAVIEKIKKKSDRSYHKEMNKIFDDVEYMNIKDTFELTRDSSREEVIKVMENIDKDILLKKIDEIPDQAIANLMKKKFRELSSITQLRDYLNKRIYRITKTPTSG